MRSILFVFIRIICGVAAVIVLLSLVLLAWIADGVPIYKGPCR